MRVHFIAIGGAVMHNLALALQQKGYRVTGSDDEIFEPSRGRLAAAGLLPEKEGWDPGRITPDIDVVILGMHAREDNPELRRAREIAAGTSPEYSGSTESVPLTGARETPVLRICSFPEFLYEQTRDKKRVVIGGSHGKTTITSMIMHVLKYHGIRFDYMVGSQVEGFETMVGLSEQSGIAVFEGDEYLTSALDRRPKFHLYHPHIALISGISWDHMNVFPEEEEYLDQFRIFIEKAEVGGSLVYCAEDPTVQELVKSSGRILDFIPYREHRFDDSSGSTELLYNGKHYPVEVFGRHNMQNLSGARTVCELLGISHEDFYRAIATFKGAGRRMQLLGGNGETAVYLDFAHAPSKVMATTSAMKDRFPERHLVAVLELHTFSSLNAEFLPRYAESMDPADTAIVYFNPRTVEHKNLSPLSPAQVKEAFKKNGLMVYTNSKKLMDCLAADDWKGCNLLIMTSGNFDGQDIKMLADKIIGNDY